MDNNNVAILRVQLDPGKTEQELVKLTASIAETKKEQAALTKVRDTGRLTEAEYTKAVVDLQFKLKGQQTQQQDLTKSLGQYRAMMSSATGSVDQLKAQSALLTRQYNALSKEERVNTEAGKELTAQLLEVNEALKQAGTNVADTRRNVGNYAASIKEAIKESGFLGGITAKVTEAQETFSKAQVIAKAAIGGNVTALGFLRLALISTGLGAIVIVLGSLIAFLTKSQTGIDLVSRKFAGLKAVVDLVIGAASEFGEKLVNALSNPKQAILDLIDVIQNNLVNRVKAIGIIFQALADRDFRKANDGLIQLTIGVTDASGKLEQFGRAALAAAKAGEAIELESQRILRAERALNVERSESRARIEGLKKLSEDTTKSTTVRANAAREAARIENALLAEQLKLQDDKIANTVRASKLDKQQTNDELDAIAELRKERADTAQESLGLQTELQNSLNSLNAEGAQKTEAARKALDEAMLKRIEADIAAGLSREAAAAKFLEDELKGDQLRTASAQKVLDEKRAAETAALEADVALLSRNLEARRLAVEQSYAEGKVSKKDYEQTIQLIEQTSIAARIALAKHYGQDTTALERQAAAIKIAQIEKVADAEKAAQDKRLQLGEEIANGLLGIFQDTVNTAGATMADFAKRSILLVIETLEREILAAQIKVLVKSFTTADSIASFGATGGLRALAIIGAMTAATAPLKAALSTSPKFAQGGLAHVDGGLIAQGPSHTNGGIPLYHQGRPAGIEIEGNEPVLTANVSRSPLLLSMASAINQLAGGRALLPASQISRHMRLGGMTAPQIRETMAGPTAPAIDYERLAEATAKALRKSPPVTKWSDFKAAEGRANYTDSLSSF